MRSRPQLNAVICGALSSRLMPSFEAAEAAIRDRFPEANNRQGSAGGWSWYVGKECVAATCFVAAPPHGRHWVAMRPRGPYWRPMT